MDRAAVVIARCAQVVEIENNQLASGHDYVSVCSKATNPIVRWRSGHRVIDVEEVIGGEVGVKRNPEQAALTRRVHCQGHKWSRQQGAILDHARASPLLTNEQ